MAASDDPFASAEIRGGLKGKTIRGGMAIGIARICAAAIQFVSIPILSRLLTPEDFGVVAMAMVFTGFAQLFVDAGLSAATIQREDLTPDQSTNLFWIASSLGVLLALLTAALAAPVGWMYGRDEVPAVMAVLAITFVLSGLTVQHNALMRRTMRFAELSTIQVAASLAAQSMTIAFAWTWQSYWALVAGQIVQAAVALIATWARCGWRPGLPRGGVGTRSMVEFGASLSAAKFVNYLSRSGDKLLIGSVLGAGVLGFYERAYKLLLFPIQSINTPLSSVMVPSLSRLVDQPESYCRAYYSAVRAVAAVGMPLVTFALVDADRVVPLVLGDVWTPSVPIFRALGPAALLATVNTMFAWVFVTQGRGLDQLRWQVTATVMTLTAFGCGLPWGAVGVAAGYSVARVAMMPIGFWLAYRNTPLTVRGTLANLAPVLASSLAAGVVTYALRIWAPPLNEPSLLSTAGLAVLVGLVYAGIAYGLGVRSWSIRPPAKTAASELSG